MKIANSPIRNLTERWFALRMTPFSGVSALIGLAFAALGVYPLLVVGMRLFWDGKSFNSSPIVKTATLPGLHTILADTTLVVATSVILSLILGGLLAWINERTDARLGVFTDAMPLINLLLPSIAGAIGWVLLLSPNAGYLNWFFRQVLGLFGVEVTTGPFGIYSWGGLILVYTLQMVPFAFLALSGGLRNLDGNLEQQAKVCGASATKVLVTVTIPALLPSVGAATFLLIWVGLATVSVPIIIAPAAHIEILSVAIVRYLSYSYPPEIDLAVGLGAFIVVVLGAIWYVQGRLLRKQRFSTLGSKSTPATPITLGRWRPVALLFILAYATVSVLLPIGALVLVSLHGFWTLDIEWSRLGLAAFRATVIDDPVTARALRNSVTLSLLGATIGVGVAAVVALWVFRSASKVSRGVDAAIKFPGAVSSLVLSVGIVLAFGGPPFALGGTIWILLLAYVVMSLPEGSVLADSAVSQIGRELSEASAVAGASDARTFLKVFLPLMMPGLLAAWALLFVRMVGDINAAAILASGSNTVVGFRILEIYTYGSIARMAALATALTGISCVVLIVALALSRRWSRWSRSNWRRVDAVAATEGV